MGQQINFYCTGEEIEGIFKEISLKHDLWCLPRGKSFTKKEELIPHKLSDLGSYKEMNLAIFYKDICKDLDIYIKQQEDKTYLFFDGISTNVSLEYSVSYESLVNDNKEPFFDSGRFYLVTADAYGRTPRPLPEIKKLYSSLNKMIKTKFPYRTTYIHKYISKGAMRKIEKVPYKNFKNYKNENCILPNPYYKQESN